MKIEAGTIISIPIDDSLAIGKILYVSSYFKRTMLLKVYIALVDQGSDYHAVIDSQAFELFYTGTVLAEKGKWPSLGFENLTEEELHCSKRIVGGDVWLLDECLGPATDHEFSTVPKMRVYNVNAIEQKVALLASN